MSRPAREAPSEVLNPPGQLVPFVYEGLCGVRHPGINGGDGLKFSFAEYAPRAICLPGFGHTPESAHLACRFVANLAARHHSDLLAMGSWDCQFCGVKASTFNLVVVSFLSPEAGTVDPIRRSVWGYGVPICRTAGACDQKAGRLTAELRDTYISGLATPSSPSCMMCGSTKDLILCSGCKVVRYCSLKCRREHHSVHKKDCRAAQREKLRDKIQEHLLKQRESHFSKFKFLREDGSRTLMTSPTFSGPGACQKVEIDRIPVKSLQRPYEYGWWRDSQITSRPQLGNWGRPFIIQEVNPGVYELRHAMVSSPAGRLLSKINFPKPGGSTLRRDAYFNAGNRWNLDAG